MLNTEKESVFSESPRLLDRVPYRRTRTPERPIAASREFYELMNERRTIREFSSKAVDLQVIQNCLKTAGTAPSGAHRQPWSFCVITDPGKKKEIREAAEKEEKSFYAERAPEEMLAALEPLGTDESKPFLEVAPCLIAIFAKSHEVQANGLKQVNYYSAKSVGIATGMLICALHNAGLSTLTHTPSPMNFLSDLLERPSHEKPFLLLVVGYPKEGVTVPELYRKPLEEIASFY